jgi:exodeoxyribonuclease VII large subunit
MLDALRNRPVLADPHTPLERMAADVNALRERGRRALLGTVTAAEDCLSHTSARLTALGPAATLARGYAIVQRSDTPYVVRSVRDAPPGTSLRIRLMDGAVGAIAASVTERDPD